MKRYIYIIVTVLFLGSCSKDIDEPTPPSEDPTEELSAESPVNRWIYNTMKTEYYWASDIPVESSLSFGIEPDRFFLSLLSNSDGKHDNGRDFYYSSIQKKNSTRDGGIEASYGLVNPCFYSYANTDNLHMQVQYVAPGSPAEAAGIKRGDIFSKFNGVHITKNNYITFYESTSITSLTRVKVDPATLIVTSQEEVPIPPAGNIYVDPFYKHTVLTIDNTIKIAYLMYGSFNPGYTPKMRNVFNQFKSNQVDALILDLRLNSGGYLSCVQQLATMLAPASALNGNLFYLQYRDGRKEPYGFMDVEKQYNLNLKKIYIIVSGVTVSSAELLINCLKPYMNNNLVIIGTTTEGKNVASQEFAGTGDSAGWMIYPIIGKLFNSEGKSDYENGFTPLNNHKVDEYNRYNNRYAKWYEFGDPQEYLLKNVISVITTGSVEDISGTRSELFIKDEIIIPKKESPIIIDSIQE